MPPQAGDSLLSAPPGPVPVPKLSPPPRFPSQTSRTGLSSRQLPPRTRHRPPKLGTPIPRGPRCSSAPAGSGTPVPRSGAGPDGLRRVVLPEVRLPAGALQPQGAGPPRTHLPQRGSRHGRCGGELCPPQMKTSGPARSTPPRTEGPRIPF